MDREEKANVEAHGSKSSSTSWTIAADHPITTLAQVLVPLAYRIAGTLPDCKLQSLRSHIIRADNLESFRTKVRVLAKSIPGVPIIPWLDEEVAGIGLHNARSTPVPPGRVLYLAAIDDAKLIEECLPLRYQGLCGKLAGRADGLRNLILACAKYDLQDRYHVCRDDLLSGIPCYFKPGVKNWIIVFLGHFHRGWVREFMRRMRLVGPKYERLFHLVRADVSIFAQAVAALSCEPPTAGQRFFDVFKRGYKHGLAFLYRNPPRAFEALSWPAIPTEVSEMKRHASSGLSLTIDEAVEICMTLLY